MIQIRWNGHTRVHTDGKTNKLVGSVPVQRLLEQSEHAIQTDAVHPSRDCEAYHKSKQYLLAPIIKSRHVVLIRSKIVYPNRWSGVSELYSKELSTAYIRISGQSRTWRIDWLREELAPGVAGGRALTDGGVRSICGLCRHGAGFHLLLSLLNLVSGYLHPGWCREKCVGPWAVGRVKALFVYRKFGRFLTSYTLITVVLVWWASCSHFHLLSIIIIFFIIHNH